MIYADLVLSQENRGTGITDHIHLGVWSSPTTHPHRGYLYREARAVLTEFAGQLIGHETLPEIVQQALDFLRQKGWSQVPFEMVRAVVQVPAAKSADCKEDDAKAAYKYP